MLPKLKKNQEKSLNSVTIGKDLEKIIKLLLILFYMWVLFLFILKLIHFLWYFPNNIMKKAPNWKISLHIPWDDNFPRTMLVTMFSRCFFGKIWMFYLGFDCFNFNLQPYLPLTIYHSFYHLKKRKRTKNHFKY